MKKFIFCLFFTILFPFLVSASPVEKAEAEAWANKKGTEILNIVSSNDADKYQKLDKILLTDVDIDYIARFVIGKYWKIMTEEQKARYSKIFKEYLMKLYKTFNLNISSSDVEFKTYDIKVGQKFTDIIMDIKLKGIETESNGAKDRLFVTFRVHKINNKIKLTDLKVVENSLSLVYRNRFYELIKQSDEDIDWFLDDFETWIPSASQSLPNRIENDQEVILEYKPENTPAE